MGDCLTIGQANDFLAKDSNRISGRIAKALAINIPWINLIDTGTFMAGISDTQRSVVQRSVAPVLSQATPAWEPFSCNLTPNTIETGHDEFPYTPQVYFEKGPKFCVTTSFSAFKNAIRMAEMSITDHVQTLWNSWLRYQMFLLSATKVVANSLAPSFESLVATGFQTNFKAGITPNSALSFRFLKLCGNYMTHVLLAGDEFKFGGGGMQKHFRLISDQQTIDALRDEIGPRSDLHFIAAGGNPAARESLMQFSWDGPYRGFAFAVDQSLLRVSQVNQDGTVVFVEPFLPQAATKGVKRVVNPAWEAAPYQVSFLCAKSSFIREIPEEFLGEGMTKFDRQYWAGDIRWHNVRDNDCNIRGDTGFHIYTLAAAMRPERPEFIMPILHVRCQDNLGLTPCTPQYYSLSV